MVDAEHVLGPLQAIMQQIVVQPAARAPEVRDSRGSAATCADQNDTVQRLAADLRSARKTAHLARLRKARKLREHSSALAREHLVKISFLHALAVRGDVEPLHESADVGLQLLLRAACRSPERLEDPQHLLAIASPHGHIYCTEQHHINGIASKVFRRVAACIK